MWLLIKEVPTDFIAECCYTDRDNATKGVSTKHKEMQMQYRRRFMKTCLVAMTTGTADYAGLASAREVAIADKKTVLPLLSGLIYTTENPGKWKGKEASHAPIAEIKGKSITIKTDHGMSKKHHIVRHTLVTESGDVIGEKTFSYDDDEAVSVFELPEGETRLYATSFCNKHDFWLTVVDV